MNAYNTRKKSFDELERTLVGRDELLNDILSELDIKGDETPRQHWILVGPRGIGKSHILTLLYHKVKRDGLKLKWIPVLFPEELRRVSNLAQFLERAVTEIIEELKDDKEISNELTELNDKTKKLQPEDRVDYLFSIIDWLHEKRGKFILLFTENLQSLLGKKISLKDQKKLRAYLQKSNSLLFIGSATTVFEALHDHSHPFYHYFHIYRLKDLTFQEFSALIKKLLIEKGFKKKATNVESLLPRLKALFAFTGGNPRMIVFLCDIIITDFPDEMLDLMDKTLDELTPYFDSFLKDIPAHQEEILNVLAEFEPAQSPKEIANRLEASQGVIRNYVKDLKKSGYIKMAFSKGKSNYYCLNEYLYRIWYQMRDSSHRNDTRWLIEILLFIYSPDALNEERKKIAHSSDSNRVFYKRLLDDTISFMSASPQFCKVIEWCTEAKIKETSKREDKSQIKKVLSLMESKKYDQAIQKLQTIVRENPSDEGAYWLWGDCLRDQGRYDEAIEKFIKTIDINPDDCAAYGAWGDCLKNQGNYEGAIKKYKKAVSIEPDYYFAYGTWGDCLKHRGNHDEAIEKYKKAVAIEPDYYDAYAAWGDCLWQMGKYDMAIEKTKKAISIDSNYPNAYWVWGACLKDQGHYKEAIEKIKKVISIEPDTYVAYQEWGDCLMSQGNYDEAIKKIKKAVSFKPDYYIAYWLWGACLRNQGHYNEAIEKFKKVIAINPDNCAAYGAWGDCLKHQGDYDGAMGKYKKAVSIEPDYYFAYGVWGDCLRSQGDYDGAIEKYKKTVAIKPDYYEAYGAWGQCLVAQGCYKEAIEKYKKIIDIKPDEIRAYLFWGECLISLEQYEEALTVFDNLLAHDPKSKEGINGYSSCLMKMGKNKEAKEKIKSILEPENPYPPALLTHGEILKNLKDNENALIAFLKSYNLSNHSPFYSINFYDEYILPLLKILKTDDYSRRFYVKGKTDKASREILTAILILMNKHDVFFENFQSMVSNNRDNKKAVDFSLLMKMVLLTVWINLRDGKNEIALRLIQTYGLYIKSLSEMREKENEIKSLALSMLKLQAGGKAEPASVRSIFEWMESDKDIPFSGIFHQAWTVLAEPDSLEGQRYLNEKGIAELVREIKDEVSKELEN